MPLEYCHSCSGDGVWEQAIRGAEAHTTKPRQASLLVMIILLRCLLCISLALSSDGSTGNNASGGECIPTVGAYYSGTRAPPRAQFAIIAQAVAGAARANFIVRSVDAHRTARYVTQDCIPQCAHEAALASRRVDLSPHEPRAVACPLFLDARHDTKLQLHLVLHLQCAK